MAQHRLIYIDDRSSKFWEATLDGANLHTAWGKIGTNGQTQTKTFADDGKAEGALAKALNEKLSKGYQYDGDTAAAPEAGKALPQTVRELRPMLAAEISADDLDAYINNDAFHFSQKVDGHRVLLDNRGEVPVAIGRNGQDSQHTPRFATGVYASQLAQVRGCVLDGELVGDTLHVFDMPVCEVAGITEATPYVERQAALGELFALWKPTTGFALLPSEHNSEAKAELALAIYKAGGEGVMLKRADAAYKGGRSNAWLKAKYLRSADFVVTDVAVGGSDNYELGVHDSDGNVVVVGRCSAIGKTDCAVGDVVEVRFLYVGANGRLYQPRMLRRRTDKAAAECVIDQLATAHVNKTVLTAADLGWTQK